MKINGTSGGDVYVSQEFIEAQTGQFSIQWDVYVDEIHNISEDPDRGGWMLIGDNSDGENGPCSVDNDTFIYMAFAKNGGGTKGTMDLIALNRYDNWTIVTTIARNLNLDQWYTIRVDIDLHIDRYRAYVDGDLEQIYRSRTKKDAFFLIDSAPYSANTGWKLFFCFCSVFSKIKKNK